MQFGIEKQGVRAFNVKIPGFKEHMDRRGNITQKLALKLLWNGLGIPP